MAKNKIFITLTNDAHTSEYVLEFDLIVHGLSERWFSSFKRSIDNNISIDDRKRFYGFYGQYDSPQKIADKINQLCAIINGHSPNLIKKQIFQDLNQDDLNYLHAIFVKYHGKYGEQFSNDFYVNSPVDVRKALGDLNIFIHRAESYKHNNRKRFVVTFFNDFPRQQLIESDFELFSYHCEWGLMRLNYCEIGKPLADMMVDNDSHMEHEDFLPQKHYSSDFNVIFWDTNGSNVLEQVKKYYYENRTLFQTLGYPEFSSKLSLGYIPLAKLVNYTSRELVEINIEKHQNVKNITYE